MIHEFLYNDTSPPMTHVINVQMKMYHCKRSAQKQCKHDSMISLQVLHHGLIHFFIRPKPLILSRQALCPRIDYNPLLKPHPFILTREFTLCCTMKSLSACQETTHLLEMSWLGPVTRSWARGAWPGYKSATVNLVPGVVVCTSRITWRLQCWFACIKKQQRSLKKTLPCRVIFKVLNMLFFFSFLLYTSTSCRRRLFFSFIRFVCLCFPVEKIWWK